MKGIKNIVFIGLTLGMLIYAVPKLKTTGLDWSLESVFGIGWIAFALLVVAAHLHQLLGVEEETKRELLKVKRMKRWKMEQALQGRRKLLQVKKIMDTQKRPFFPVQGENGLFFAYRCPCSVLPD